MCCPETRLPWPGLVQAKSSTGTLGVLFTIVIRLKIILFILFDR